MHSFDGCCPEFGLGFLTHLPELNHLGHSVGTYLANLFRNFVRLSHFNSTCTKNFLRKVRLPIDVG